MAHPHIMGDGIATGAVGALHPDQRRFDRYRRKYPLEEELIQEKNYAEIPRPI
jgi:hypothetical protein